MSRSLGVGLEHGDAPGLQFYTRRELDELLEVLARRRIVPERFPVRGRLHKGEKGGPYHELFAPALRALPGAWVRPLGWHLMAF
jgi:hypothetical protein